MGFEFLDGGDEQTVEAKPQSSRFQFLDEADSVEKSETKSIPQKVVGSASTGERIKTALTAGIPAAVGGVKPEQIPPTLPMVGQTIGGGIGGLPGSVAGATIGKAVQQGLEEGKLIPKELGTEALTTAAVESVFRLPAAAMFKKLRASKQLQQFAGRQLGEQKKRLAELGQQNPEFRMASSKVLESIENHFGKISDTSGAAGALLKRWKNILKRQPTVTTGQLIEFENRLGDVAKFVNDPGVQQVKNKAANAAARLVRKDVSGVVDKFAAKAGFKNFGKLNKQVGKLIQETTFRRGGLRDTALQLGASGSLGVGIGALSGNPAAGAIGTVGLLGALNPNIQSALFKALESTGAGRAATVATTDAIRKALE